MIRRTIFALCDPVFMLKDSYDLTISWKMAAILKNGGHFDFFHGHCSSNDL